MSKSRRKPTQRDVQEKGECGHGFNYGGPGGTPRYCGQPSEPGATFGDCSGHAREFRAYVREIDQRTARVTEVGPRVLRAMEIEQLRPASAVVRRAREAQDRGEQKAIDAGREGPQRAISARGPRRQVPARTTRTRGTR